MAVPKASKSTEQNDTEAIKKNEQQRFNGQEGYPTTFWTLDNIVFLNRIEECPKPG